MDAASAVPTSDRCDAGVRATDLAALWRQRRHHLLRGGHSAEYEGYNVQTQRVEKYTNVAVPSSSAFEFGTKNLGANLTMNFYF